MSYLKVKRYIWRSYSHVGFILYNIFFNVFFSNHRLECEIIYFVYCAWDFIYSSLSLIVGDFWLKLKINNMYLFNQNKNLFKMKLKIK